MTFEIPTGEMRLELHLTLEARVPCVLSLLGYDAGRKNTRYFNRGYGLRIPGDSTMLFKGGRTIIIPMPLSPEILSLRIQNDISFNNVSVVQIDAKPLVQSNMWLNAEEIDFINFAFDFSRDAGTIAPDNYLSDYENYIVKYLPVIKNRESGAIITTPARVNRRTGIIEVARDKFSRYTVFMRIIILFHEFFHWELDTRSEQKADFNAITWAMNLGLPETEIMYAFTKVFPSGNEALEQREKDNIAFIKNHKLMRSLKV